MPSESLQSMVEKTATVPSVLLSEKRIKFDLIGAAGMYVIKKIGRFKVGTELLLGEHKATVLPQEILLQTKWGSFSAPTSTIKNE